MEFLRSRNWCFTDWKLENIDKIYNDNSDIIRYVCYGYEIGKKSEKPHYQGWLQLTKPLSKKNILKKIFKNTDISIRCCKGSELQNEVYCKKDGEWKSFGEYIKIQGKNTGSLINDIEQGSKLEDIIETYPLMYYRFRNGIKDHIDVINKRNIDKNIAEKFEDFELNNSQSKIIEHVDKQNDRQITWVFDHEGGKGKSTLAKYMYVKYKSINLKNGKSNDISNMYNGEKYITFDFSRSQEEHINYSIIEDLKNGSVVSTKYNGKSLFYDNPRIVIFANFLPNTSAWSTDRYDIIYL